MNKGIQPAITPLNLGHVIKHLTAYETCTEDTNRRELTVVYLAGGEGWA